MGTPPGSGSIFTGPMRAASIQLAIAFDRVYRLSLEVNFRQFGNVWVQSAGNNSLKLDPQGRPLLVVDQGDSMPTNLGNRDSDMIVVGAANPDGTLAPFSAPRGVHPKGVLVQDENDPRLAAFDNPNLGWTDVYAPGVDVPTCNVDGTFKLASGTSPASALMAGLVAYLLGAPQHASYFAWSPEANRHKSWGRRAKEMVTALSYQWVDGPAGILSPSQEWMRGRFPYNLPTEINMAYNGGWGPMNTCPLSGRKRGVDTGIFDDDTCVITANDTEVTTWATDPLTTETTTEIWSFPTTEIVATLATLSGFEDTELSIPTPWATAITASGGVESTITVSVDPSNTATEFVMITYTSTRTPTATATAAVTVTESTKSLTTPTWVLTLTAEATTT